MSGSSIRGIPVRYPALLALLAGSSVSALTSQAQAQSTDPFPAVIELSSLLPVNGGDGSVGFVVPGVDSGDWSGVSVAGGDVNGDGVPDLVVGAETADPNGELSAGETYVIFGRQGLGGTGEMSPAALNGQNGYVIRGIELGDRSGHSVAAGGDHNADGVGDVLIGAYLVNVFSDRDIGESFILFGGAGVGSSGVVELSTLGGSSGYSAVGIDAIDYSGGRVAFAGDLNADGTDDVIIGAGNADPNEVNAAGECYVLFGGPDGVGASRYFLNSIAPGVGVRFAGIDSQDQIGSAITSPGDINADGIDDLLIGASRAEVDGQDLAGEVYLIFGSDTLSAASTFDLASLNGANGVRFVGSNAGDQCGISVSGAGDLNDDGFDDMIVGARYADFPGRTDAGAYFVVFGGPEMNQSAEVELYSLNGTKGFEIQGAAPTDQAGVSAAALGDVNGDGIDDIAISGIGSDPDMRYQAGATYVLFGGPQLGAAGPVDLATLDGSDGFVLYGVDAGDEAGWSLAGPGDLNEDGINDVVIGAKKANPGGRADAGSCYVVFGRDLSDCTPDLNADGIVDQGDIQSFVALFLVQDLAVDFNADGIVDLGDIQSFIAAFLEGC